jgi:O-antigen/teichoic acid export membrane protein
MNVKANIVWSIATNIIIGLGIFINQIVIARMAGREMLGLYILAISVINPLIPVTLPSLRDIVVSDAKNEFSLSKVVATRVAGVFAVFVPLSVAGLVLARGNPVYGFVLALLSISTAFDGIGDQLNAVCQKANRMNLITYSKATRSSLCLLLNLVVLHQTKSLVLAALSTMTVSALVTCLVDVNLANRVLRREPSSENYRRVGLEWDWGTSYRLALLVIPLSITVALGAFTLNVPRYALSSYSGLAMLGVFGALSAFCNPLRMTMIAIGQSLFSRLSVFYVQGDVERIRGNLRKVLALCAGVCLAAVAVIAVAGDYLVSIFGKGYTGYTLPLIILAIAYSISGATSIYGNICTAARWFKGQTVIAGASLALGLPLAYSLVPNYGLFGAALSLLATTSFGCILFAIVTANVLNQRLRETRL